MSEEIQTQISSSPLGAELSDEECGILAGIVSLRQLDDEQVLIREGESDNSLHVVLSGKLGVTKNTGGGDLTTLAVLRNGSFAGEMGFIDGREHSASLQALGAAEVLSLEREALESLLNEHPHLVYQVMRSIVRSSHDIVRRMNSQYVELTNYITKSHGRY